MNNSRKVQRRIDRYLANVGRALDHLELDERREILDGLRTHIREELAQQGSTPSNVDDVRTVLSSMDSPQAYRAETTAGRSPQATQSRTLGRLGFYFFLGGIGLAAMSLLLGALVAEALFRGGLILSGVLAVCALGLGIAGWRDPYGKAATIGTVLALACVLIFLPARQSSTGPNVSEPLVETTQSGT
ncbi:hypothetical protein KAJ02_12840 [Candidatus Bipolaricaulota bacterium]|nr:hypothetical protein [Candidatus Bipolaricaulota bacterium]